MQRVFLSCLVIFCLLPHVLSFGGTIDLAAITSAQGLTFGPPSLGVDLGSSVASCDFNGDGKKDVIIGAPNANAGSGAVIIIFGGSDFSTVDLSDPAASGSGLIISNPGESGFGTKVACLGNADINTVTEDLLIGEGLKTTFWVVFGQTLITGNQDISSFVMSVIQSTGGDDLLDAVAVGDVTGDGYGDAIISAYDGSFYRGVLLSKFSYPLVDIASPDLPLGVVWIMNSGQLGPMTFAPAGDFNDDGYNDFVVGDIRGSPITNAAAVVTGTNAGVTPYPSPVLFLDSLGLGTFPKMISILGSATFLIGTSVGYAGDVNGDSVGDILVGIYDTSSDTGAVFVVFGASTFATNRNLLGIPGNSQGYVIKHGINTGYKLGTTVFGGLKSGSGSTVAVCDETTSCYFHFLTSSINDVDAMLSEDGFRIFNTGSTATNPMQIALIGDVNSDGSADYVIGQPSLATVFILYGPNKCTSPCKTCSSLASADWAKCVSCESGLGVDLVYNYKCYASCPSHSYAASSTSCATCYASCLDCTGPTASECSSCDASGSSPLFYSNACYSVGSCPSGTYQGSSTTCNDCGGTCEECSGSATHCTSCPAGNFLYNNVCYGSCPSHSYQFSSTTCATCNSRCLDCSTTANNCDTCDNTGSYPLFYNNFCYATCPSHSYQFSSTTCATCDNNCENCAGSPTTCTSCDTSGSSPLFSNSACYSSCPPTAPYSYSSACYLSCPPTAPYSYSFACYGECPSGTILDTNNACINLAPEVPTAVQRLSYTDKTRQISNEIMSTISSLIVSGVHSIRSQAVQGPVSYYVFLNVDYPENYEEFGGENFGSSRLVNPFKYTGKSSRGRVKSVNMHLENQSLLANVGYSILFLLICILLIPLNDTAVILLEKHKKDYKGKWYYELLKRSSISLRWSFLINQFVSKYQDLAFFSFLGIYNAGEEDSDDRDILNLVVCIFGFLVTVAGLAGAFFIIKTLTKKLEAFSEEEKEKEEYNKDEFLGRRVVLYKDLKKDKFRTMLYPFFLMVRVFGFSFVTIFLCNQTAIQLGFLNLHAVIMLVYILKYRPLEEKGQLCMTLAYEIDGLVALLGVTLLAIYNAADGTNENTRTAFGYMIIAANIGMLILNFISFALEMHEYASLIWESLKTVYQKVKNRKRVKVRPEPIQSHDGSFMSPTATFTKEKELELQPPLTGTPDGHGGYFSDESPEMTSLKKVKEEKPSPYNSCLEGGLADDKSTLLKFDSSLDLRKMSSSAQKRPSSSIFKFAIEEKPETEV